MSHDFIVGASIPILKDGSFDYSEDGNNFPSYKAHIRVISGDNPSAEIGHQLMGDSVVSYLMDEGKAQFGCELVFKGSFKRVFHLQSGEPSGRKSLQCIQWNASDVCQKIFFRPVIVSIEDIENLTLTDDHKVSALWSGANISIPEYTVLADAEMNSPDVSAKSLLRIIPKKEFPDFEMDVSKPMGGSGRTHFKVYVGIALFNLLRSADPDDSDLRRAIFINALTGAFSVLAREFQQDSKSEKEALEACDILRSLRSKLKELGVETWDENPEEFSPLRAATSFEQFSWSSQPSMEEHDDES